MPSPDPCRRGSAGLRGVRDAHPHRVAGRSDVPYRGRSALRRTLASMPGRSAREPLQDRSRGSAQRIDQQSCIIPLLRKAQRRDIFQCLGNGLKFHAGNYAQLTAF